MSAEWLRVLRRTEKLGRMSLFELWVAQIKLFLSWTSDILSFLSASKFPHQTFVTWWKNQNTSRKKKQKKKGKSRTCSKLSAFWAENNQRWRPNADECRRSNNSECLCPEENSNLFLFPTEPLPWRVVGGNKKHTRVQKKKKTSVALLSSPSSGRLCNWSCWNILLKYLQTSASKVPWRFWLSDWFPTWAVCNYVFFLSMFFSMHTEKRKSGAPWLICHCKSAIIELNYI